MSEVLFWDAFLKFMLPSLLLCVGLLMGVVVTLLIPISDEEKKEAAKEIEETISEFANEFAHPFDGLGMIGLRAVFFYVIGIFIILVLGTTLSDILDLPVAYDMALRMATAAANHLPTIILIIVMLDIGQYAVKVTGIFIKWFMKIPYLLSALKKSLDTHEEEVSS